MRIQEPRQVAARQVVKLALKRGRYPKVIGLRQRLAPGLAALKRGRYPKVVGLRRRLAPGLAALKRGRYPKVIGLRRSHAPGLAVVVPRGRLVLSPSRLLGLRRRRRS